MNIRSTFLGSVANYFHSGNGDTSRPSLSAITFVTPNKRSALFLKKYVRESCAGITLMPRFMTLRTFLNIYSDFPAAQPRELLFVLYDAYRRVMDRRGRTDAIRQFDSFVFWGDMMLADFDDVDRSLVDADDIFRNLKNVKEIQADYLDEYQKDAIRRVWGESRLTAHIEEFWLHLGEGEQCRMGEKFVFLWEVLADIYHEYKASMARFKRASEGSQYRMAVKNARNYDAYDFTGDTRYAFVGFNDLCHAETVIFERLRSRGAAYFFWDTAPLHLFASAIGGGMPRPLLRLRELAKSFPMPDGYTVPLPEELPEISVTSVPSNVAQAKCVGKVLKEWAGKGYLDCTNAINTAIILPDQGLLLPTLLSIPDDIKAINISMGLAYRTTTFASLLHSIISMQLRARKIRGEYNYYFEDLNAVLGHPHIQAIASEAAGKVTEFVNGHKLYNAPAGALCETAPELKAIFTPVHNTRNATETARYLGSLLDWLGSCLTQNSEQSGSPGGSFELEAIKYFRDELDRLTELIGRHGVEMTDHTFLHLFERIFTTRGLSLTGTPLKGLQVLGVLETRGLDFDNVIVLSMNESVFPRKQYTRTMIPNSLRSGYGLPDFDSPEWSYAYSFYRLISRAKRVALFYDSRTDGLGMGEKSRYISQIEYLVPALKMSQQTLLIGAAAGDRKQFDITKTEAVTEALDGYRPGGDKRLSASALKTYLECPFRFYLMYVRNMRDNDELTDSLTAAEIGTIVHGSIQSFFETYKRGDIDAGVMTSWLEGDKVGETVAEQIRLVHFGGRKAPHTHEFTPDIKIGASNIEIYVRSNIEAELAAYCRPAFRFIANEFQVNTLKEGTVWHIADGIDINFYMSIDRVDEIAPGYLRFIDFKTGGDKTRATSVDAIFDKYDHSLGGIFQLLLYCEAYMCLRDNSVDIQPMLHPLRELAASAPLAPLTIERSPLTHYSAVRDKFRQRLSALIEEIFDTTKAFTQCEDTDNCRYCPFITLCGRNIKE